MTLKKYSIDFKQQVIQEAVKTGNNSVMARRHDLSTSMVSRWVSEHKKAKYQTGNGTSINIDQISKENQQLYYRTIVGYHIGLRCEGKDAARTLQQSLWKRKLYHNKHKPIIRSDNGP